MNEGRLRMQKTKEKHPSDWDSRTGDTGGVSSLSEGGPESFWAFLFFFEWRQFIQLMSDNWVVIRYVRVRPDMTKRHHVTAFFFLLAQHHNYPAAPVATRSRRTPWKRHKTGKWNQIKEEDFPEPKPPDHPRPGHLHQLQLSDFTFLKWIHLCVKPF